MIKLVKMLMIYLEHIFNLKKILIWVEKSKNKIYAKWDNKMSLNRKTANKYTSKKFYLFSLKIIQM